MRSPADFQRPGGVHYPTFDSTVQDGELKTRNVPSDEIQRPVITDREDSMFTVYVELVGCVHGTLTPGGSPASLIIFQYEIHCRQDKNVVRSVDTNFEFSQTGWGTPSVIAYGPYIQRRFNATTGTVSHQRGLEVAVGAEFDPAMAGAKYSVQQERSHEQQYFDKIDSGRHHNESEKRHYSVWWRYTHNSDQNHGVVPAFRTAMLLKRDDMDPFSATFTIKLDAGFQYGVSQKLKYIFSKREVDDIINFDPKAEPWPNGTMIDSTSLGNLARDAMLDSKLTPIWGVDIGTGTP
jgi:hypothetical protein